LRFPMGDIKGVEVLPRNLVPIRSLIARTQLPCLLNDLHQLGILSQQKRKKMAMDEVCYCNIHTSGSIGVNRIATKLHLCEGSALDFLSPWVKERAWSTVRGVLLLRLELSVTAQERFKAGRKGKLSSSVSPPNSASVEPADDLGDNAYRNGGETPCTSKV